MHAVDFWTEVDVASTASFGCKDIKMGQRLSIVRSKVRVSLQHVTTRQDNVLFFRINFSLTTFCGFLACDLTGNFPLITLGTPLCSVNQKRKAIKSASCILYEYDGQNADPMERNMAAAALTKNTVAPVARFRLLATPSRAVAASYGITITFRFFVLIPEIDLSLPERSRITFKSAMPATPLSSRPVV